MKKYTKILGFVAVGLLIGLAARLIPHKPVNITPPKIKALDAQPSIPSVNTTELLQQYKIRPLFISKSAIDAEPMNTPQTNIAEDWSPLDYQLIGISRTGGKKTGWFKHVETGELILARRGMQLGGWALEYLSSTEARLSSGNETENLKLFQGQKLR